MTDGSALTVSTPWVAWIVLLPLAGAALSFLLGRRAARTLALPTASGILLCAGGLCRQVGESGPLRYAVGGWGAPIGIDWHVDGLSVLMLLMTAVVGSGVSVYALGYFPRKQTGGNGRSDALFWPLWFFLWAALNALFLSADIFNIYVTLELVGLAAVALVAYSGTAAAVRAATRYFFVAMMGSLCYLLGVALVYASCGVLDIATLGKLMAPGPASWAAIALMTTGLLAKGALFPLHFWLPPAHANAPAPVSAALSALVVTAAFSLVLRLWFQAFGAALTPGAGLLLGLLGAAAILWGSVLALCQTRLKMLVAYSTVAQLGYLFLPFAMAMTSRSSAAGGAVDWAAPALSGGIYHALSHAAAKAAMFMAAGIVIQVLGHDRITGVGGGRPARASDRVCRRSRGGQPDGLAAQRRLCRKVAAAERGAAQRTVVVGGGHRVGKPPGRRVPVSCMALRLCREAAGECASHRAVQHGAGDAAVGGDLGAAGFVWPPIPWRCSGAACSIRPWSVIRTFVWLPGCVPERVHGDGT